MKRMFFVSLTVMIGTSLLGCAGANFGKQATGAVIGGIGGGVIGSRIGKGRGKLIATIAGTVVGALAGGAIGKQLEERDRLLMAQTTQGALENSPSGTAVEWRNPDSGNRGTIVPRPAYQSARGRYCREFKQTIIIGGRLKMGYGTACRQPDGSWRIAS